MSIERLQPMAVHKNMIMRVLRDDPASMKEMWPTRSETAAEMIALLQADEGEWFIDGELLPSVDGQPDYSRWKSKQIP